jgi:hypothetical protein
LTFVSLAVCLGCIGSGIVLIIANARFKQR